MEGKEIKRYKNIDIPDDLKKLEYQGFEFNVPLNGNITFKVSFAPGVLPEEFPTARERRTRSLNDALAAVESKTLIDMPLVDEDKETVQEIMDLIIIH